jgi:hypothetical protein
MEEEQDELMENPLLKNLDEKDIPLAKNLDEMEAPLLKNLDKKEEPLLKNSVESSPVIRESYIGWHPENGYWDRTGQVREARLAIFANIGRKGLFKKLYDNIVHVMHMEPFIGETAFTVIGDDGNNLPQIQVKTTSSIDQILVKINLLT